MRAVIRPGSTRSIPGAQLLYSGCQIRALSSNEKGLDKASFLSHFPLPDLLGDRLFIVLDFKNDRCIDYEV